LEIGDTTVRRDIAVVGRTGSMRRTVGVRAGNWAMTTNTTRTRTTKAKIVVIILITVSRTVVRGLRIAFMTVRRKWALISSTVRRTLIIAGKPTKWSMITWRHEFFVLFNWWAMLAPNILTPVNNNMIFYVVCVSPIV
jgi:hypothetical protein